MGCRATPGGAGRRETTLPARRDAAEARSKAKRPEDLMDDGTSTSQRCQALLMKCVVPHWAPKAVSGAVDALVGTFQNG